MLQVDQFISSPLPMALPASPTTPGEVLSIVKKLRNNKSPGHDLINNKIVKNLPPKTIILLTYIFNAIFRLSYFPTTWKSALIIVIPKPGKQPDLPESYRPISLLPTFGKIFEKLLLKRLELGHLISNTEIISPFLKIKPSGLAQIQVCNPYKTFDAPFPLISISFIKDMANLFLLSSDVDFNVFIL
ncbi:hypothetical protein QTP88_026442 [Uroleucon formosanum]